VSSKVYDDVLRPVTASIGPESPSGLAAVVGRAP
jgi:hypothetical protein